MKKSIFSKIGDRIRNKPNKNSKTVDQIHNTQNTGAKDDSITEVNEAVKSELDEERKQDFAEETSSDSEVKDTNQNENTLNKEQSLEKTDSKAENVIEDDFDENKSSDTSDDESKTEFEAEDKKSKSDDIDSKENEDSKNRDDDADNKSADVADQSVEDVLDTGSTIGKSDDAGSGDDDFTRNLEYDAVPQEMSDMTDSTDDKSGIKKTNEEDTEDDTNLNREAEIDTDDFDNEQEEETISEDLSEKEDDQLSEQDGDADGQSADTPDAIIDNEDKIESSSDDADEDDEPKEASEATEDSVESNDISDEIKDIDNVTDDDADKSEASDNVEESDEKSDNTVKDSDELDESEDSSTDESENVVEESKDKAEIEDITDDDEKQSENTDDVIEKSEDQSEEANDVEDKSEMAEDASDNTENETDNQEQPELSQSDFDALGEIVEDAESDKSESIDTEIIEESVPEDIEETDQTQQDVESVDQTADVEADTVDEEAGSDDSIEDAAPIEGDFQDAGQNDANDEEDETDKTTDTEESKKTEISDSKSEDDILSEVASSQEAQAISEKDSAIEDISEPTEELPIISGAMLDAQTAFSELDDDKKEPSVDLSDEEIAELSEIEPEPEPVSQSEEDETAKDETTEVSSTEDKELEDLSTEKASVEDVADFFVVPDLPDKKDTTSDHDGVEMDKTDVLPISETDGKTGQQDKAAQAGKVIDLSEPEEEAETKDKTDTAAKEPSKKPEKRKKGKIALGVLAAIVGVLAICYVGGYFFYQNHFFFGTQLSGVNASNKTVEEVEKSIEKDAKDYKLTLKEREGQSETITAKDINLRYSDNNPVQAALNKQNAFKWPLAVFGINDDELPSVYKYDEALLNKKIQSLNAVSSMVNAEDAHPVYSEGRIIIKGMIQGNEVDTKTLTDSVKKAIAKGDETLDLEASKIYKNPTYGEDAQEVEAAKKVMEGYLKSEITYTIGEAKEVLDKDDFGPWLLTDESMNVYIDQVQAADWIHQNLGSKYDTAWGEHDFKNSAGQQMKVEGGNYGWEIDETTELDQLMALIPTGQKNTHEPAWSQTALTGKGTHADIGNTYIEISLGSQHMWCYKDGKLVIETDVVTGDVNLGRGTPAGVFYIYGMQENATLVGEDYRTPVAYWMPFNGGVGIHDSTWRGASEYGGTTYMGNGSHGCVNTPLDVVAVIFQNADVGEPVVVYY